jgi:hypothetical protein
VQGALFALGIYQQLTDPRLDVLNRIGATVAISRRVALVLTVNATLILLPVCRNLIHILWTRFVPFEHCQWLHKHVAYSLVLCVVNMPRLGCDLQVRQDMRQDMRQEMRQEVRQQTIC